MSSNNTPSKLPSLSAASAYTLGTEGIIAGDDSYQWPQNPERDLFDALTKESFRYRKLSDYLAQLDTSAFEAYLDQHGDNDLTEYFNAIEKIVLDQDASWSALSDDIKGTQMLATTRLTLHYHEAARHEAASHDTVTVAPIRRSLARGSPLRRPSPPRLPDRRFSLRRSLPRSQDRRPPRDNARFQDRRPRHINTRFQDRPPYRNNDASRFREYRPRNYSRPSPPHERPHMSLKRDATSSTINHSDEHRDKRQRFMEDSATSNITKGPSSLVVNVRADEKRPRGRRGGRKVRARRAHAIKMKKMEQERANNERLDELSEGQILRISTDCADRANSNDRDDRDDSIDSIDSIDSVDET